MRREESAGVGEGVPAREGVTAGQQDGRNRICTCAVLLSALVVLPWPLSHFKIPVREYFSFLQRP